MGAVTTIEVGILVGMPTVMDILSVDPITEPRAPHSTSNNMTGWLTDRINENATGPVMQGLKENFASGDPIKIAGATKAWVALVRTGATWDYKVDISKSGKLDTNQNVVLGGKTLNYQAIANIHFGAMGKAAGVPQWILEARAGAFQVKDHLNDPSVIGSVQTYFDDLYDKWMVNFGAWLYDQFGKLPPEQLTEALGRYEKGHGSPGEPLGGK
jgi:hypothetical protein